MAAEYVNRATSCMRHAPVGACSERTFTQGRQLVFVWNLLVMAHLGERAMKVLTWGSRVSGFGIEVAVQRGPMKNPLKFKGTVPMQPPPFPGGPGFGEEMCFARDSPEVQWHSAGQQRVGCFAQCVRPAFLEASGAGSCKKIPRENHETP